MEWVATGRVFARRGGARGGLVRSVHAPDELLPAARALAREIADNTAPVSVALARQMMWRMLGADHPMEAHRVDSRAMFSRGQSADAREGVTSFLEKRDAQFPDRVSAGLPDVFPDWERAELPYLTRRGGPGGPPRSIQWKPQERFTANCDATSCRPCSRRSVPVQVRVGAPPAAFVIRNVLADFETAVIV